MQSTQNYFYMYINQSKRFYKQNQKSKTLTNNSILFLHLHQIKTLFQTTI